MRRFGLLLLLVTAVLAIVGYNFYAVRSGACPCQEFWSLPPLIAAGGLLLLAGLGFWLLRHRTDSNDHLCSGCRRRCAADWHYCPDCGATLAPADKEMHR